MRKLWKVFGNLWAFFTNSFGSILDFFKEEEYFFSDIFFFFFFLEIIYYQLFELTLSDVHTSSLCNMSSVCVLFSTEVGYGRLDFQPLFGKRAGLVRAAEIEPRDMAGFGILNLQW